jgi:hypothetical protein
VGRACGTHGRGEKCTRFAWESPKERYHSEYKGVDGIRMDLSEIGFGGGGLESTGSGKASVASCCECGDELSGSGATLLNQGLRTCGSAGHIIKCFNDCDVVFLADGDDERGGAEFV